MSGEHFLRSTTRTMPRTARKHFDEDLRRVEDVLFKADAMETAGEPFRLFQDVRLSGVALAVGAMDAYLCDAYVDCLSAALQAYRRGAWPGGQLPKYYRRQLLPAGEVLDASRAHRPLWSIRMAARRVMERDNMLAVSRVKEMFDGILPAGQRLWDCMVDPLLRRGYKRFTGPLSSMDMARLAAARPMTTSAQKRLSKARKAVMARVRERLSETVQLRHDWIHNCGRPNVAISRKTGSRARMHVCEIEWFVGALDDHLESHRRV